jgi:hydrogenase nickel incorporation protein HypA/HybF
MHEASLMADLIRKITTLAEAQQARHVTGVRVTLGALSHLSPDHLRAHFVQATRGIVAAGARLDIDARTDITEPMAQDIRLDSIEVEAEMAPGSSDPIKE